MILFEGKKFIVSLLMTGAVLLAGGLTFAKSNSALADPAIRNVDEKVFFKKVRKSTHRRGLDDIQFQTYKQIINYWNDHKGMDDPRWLAYVMATAYHETRLKPVREGYAKTDAGARRIVNRMWRQRRITLPYHRADRVTGHVYYGRGYVQLTWAENYKKMGRAIGMGDALYRNPDLVLDPEIASKILFVGMLKGKFRYSRRRHPKGPQKLSLFFKGKKANWYGARNIINGDMRKNGKRIGGYGRKYASAIRFIAAPDKPPAPEPDPNEGTDTPPTEGEVVPTLPGSDTPGTDVADAGTPGGGTGDDGAGTGGGTPTAPVPVDPVPVDPVPVNPVPVNPVPVDPTPTTPVTPDPTTTDPTPEDTSTDDDADLVDDAGEVVPSLPEDGELVPDPSEPVTDTPAGGDLVVNPIPVEEETEVANLPGGTSGTTGTEAGSEQPGSSEEASGGSGAITGDSSPTDVTKPKPEDEKPDLTAGSTAGSAEGAPPPAENKGWWGSVKSFFGKYSKYVWKF